MGTAKSCWHPHARRRIQYMAPKRLLLLALLCAGTPALASEEPPPYRIVRPSGEAHELLPKTCGVCHKDEQFHFFVIAAPTEEGINEAYDLFSVSGAAVDAPPKPKNPHLGIACLFCHMEQPAQGADPAAMTFRTLEGTGVVLDQVTSLCQMCHPEGEENHAKVLPEGADPAVLEEHGLPVRDGKAVCSTCHEMHGEEAGPPDVRMDFVRFASRSVNVYPHGNRAACGACHPGEPAPGNDPAFIDPDPRSRCVRCHVEDHDRIHPARVESTDETYPMDFLDFPLGEDALTTCSTCHDHVCADDVVLENPRFLRGGPYLPFTEFCYLCHPKAGGEGLDPHEQVSADGKVITTTCIFCHRVVPEDPAGGDFRQGDLLYLRTPVELCMRCHDPGPHPVGVNHLLELRSDMPARLSAYEKQHKIKLPLDAAGRVVCTTCHNPHAKGVLRGDAALGAGETHGWRVPSFAQLCSPCHGRMD